MHATVPASGVGERLDELLQLACTADERAVARRSAYRQLLDRQRFAPWPELAP
jgi:hypothetical protein